MAKLGEIYGTRMHLRKVLGRLGLARNFEIAAKSGDVCGAVL